MPEPTQRYVLLPNPLDGSPLTGRGSICSLVSPYRPGAAEESLPAQALSELLLDQQAHLVDALTPAGAQLVDLTPRGLGQLAARHPELRVVPERWYQAAYLRPPTPRAKPHQAHTLFRLRVLDAHTGKPVPHAQVCALTDRHKLAGIEGLTDSRGEVHLRLPASGQLERLQVHPRSGYWTLVQDDVALTPDYPLPLIPINLADPDALRACYSQADLADGQGLRVAVLDTGIAPHPDLQVHAGYNAVPYEPGDEWQDNGQGHGTHVAGIIAGRGRAPTGIRGLAPGVELRSYRIFAAGSDSASSWAIAKAVHQALEDGCDLLNLSLGGGPFDPTLEAAICATRQRGAMLFCAAGNDGRAPVSYPASDPQVLAVGALGLEGTWPPHSEQQGHVLRPPHGADPRSYVPAFANVGVELDLIAPGDGLISTFPGGYAVMAGTSMACPAALARVAVLLSRQPGLLNRPRNLARAQGIEALARGAALPLGFGFEAEGHGLLP